MVMKRGALIGLILLLAVALIWLAVYWEPERRESGELAKAPTGGDFALVSAAGPVELKALRGKLVVLFFGYTSCPDVCPTSLGLLSMAFSELQDSELEQVQGLFISVDPERDSLERLQEYGEYFHPQILGITGSPEQVTVVADMYGAAYRKSGQGESSNYMMDHTADLYVIDQTGRLHSRIRHGTPARELLQLLRQLLGPDS